MRDAVARGARGGFIGVSPIGPDEYELSMRSMMRGPQAGPDEVGRRAAQERAFVTARRARDEAERKAREERARFERAVETELQRRPATENA